LKGANIIGVSSVSSLRTFKHCNPIDNCSKRMFDTFIESLEEKYNPMTIFLGASDTEMLQKTLLNRLR